MELKRNLPFWLTVSIAAGGVALVLLAPWARSQGWALAPWIYAVFFPVCHQIAERSFHAFGEPLAVCHRCFGLYLGFGAGLVLLAIWEGGRRRLLAAPRTILLFFVPMFLDVALFSVNTGLSRFVTGLVAALPLGLLVWAAAAQLAAGSRPFARREI